MLNIFADKIYTEIKKQSENKIEIVFNSVTSLMKGIKGAYSIISIINEIGLLAFRDPNGIRPLSFGKKSTPAGDEYIFASEDAAFHPSGFKKIRDIKLQLFFFCKTNAIRKRTKT